MRAVTHLLGMLSFISALALSTVSFALDNSNIDRVKAGIIAVTSGSVTLVSSGGEPIARDSLSGHPIYLGQQIETGPAGKLQILLMDRTTMTIGPNSLLVIDEFIYQPNEKRDFSASLVKGALRLSSPRLGSLPNSNRKLRLPNATISIRGTEFASYIKEDGTDIYLLNGAINIANNLSNVDINKPNFGLSVSQDGVISDPRFISETEMLSLLERLEPKPSSADQQEAEESGDPNAKEESEKEVDEEAEEEAGSEDDTETAEEAGTKETGAEEAGTEEAAAEEAGGGPQENDDSGGAQITAGAEADADNNPEEPTVSVEADASPATTATPAVTIQLQPVAQSITSAIPVSVAAISANFDSAQTQANNAVFGGSSLTDQDSLVTANQLVSDGIAEILTETASTDDTDSASANPDRDGDGVLNAVDQFPDDATEYADTDGDGIGNNADTDDDGDGVADSSDAFPLDSTETVDTDSDGIGDNSDTMANNRLYAPGPDSGSTYFDDGEFTSSTWSNLASELGSGVATFSSTGQTATVVSGSACSGCTADVDTTVRIDFSAMNYRLSSASDFSKPGYDTLTISHQSGVIPLGQSELGGGNLYTPSSSRALDDLESTRSYNNSYTFTSSSDPSVTLSKKVEVSYYYHGDLSDDSDLSATQLGVHGYTKIRYGNTGELTQLNTPGHALTPQ